MEKSKQEQKKKSNRGRWYFLGIVIIFYLPIYFISKSEFFLIFDFFKKLLFQILPIFIFVYFLMVLINYFINNEVLKKYLGEGAGIKGWLIAIITGILSVGPIYMWYPLMKELKEKGIKYKFIATFLYNRGIKLQWAPILVVYFGWKYSMVLLLTMAIFSILQGIITEKLIEISHPE